MKVAIWILAGAIVVLALAVGWLAVEQRRAADPRVAIRALEKLDEPDEKQIAARREYCALIARRQAAEDAAAAAAAANAQ